MVVTKDIFENVVKETEGIQGTLHYIATESEITNEDFTSKVYGIRIENRFNDIVKEVEEITDISPIYDDIVSLLKLMSKNKVTPVSARYIVEDYII